MTIAALSGYRSAWKPGRKRAGSILNLLLVWVCGRQSGASRRGGRQRETIQLQHGPIRRVRRWAPSGRPRATPRRRPGAGGPAAGGSLSGGWRPLGGHSFLQRVWPSGRQGPVAWSARADDGGAQGPRRWPLVRPVVAAGDRDPDRTREVLCGVAAPAGLAGPSPPQLASAISPRSPILEGWRGPAASLPVWTSQQRSPEGRAWMHHPRR